MRFSKEMEKGFVWKTREVKVGNVGIGGSNPIRIQSMTTTSTRDVEATIEQIMRLSDVGCEIARVTVQGKKEAEACEKIKNGLLKKGYEIPLVADIHFYPAAAMMVVDFVDKVRINPGNFVDPRASFIKLEYDDESYDAELRKIDQIFGPLVQRCIELKKGMRIGTNHGSLSDRIMNRFGDTPRGMVESALEFANVCRKKGFHDFMFSMKSSNPLVMVKAYRLLVYEMIKMGWDYPLHLGVTEAGEGEDGRLKSAVGIGSLLLDGLGDTIRVSLTEEPEAEIDPCKRLVRLAENYRKKECAPFVNTWQTLLFKEERRSVKRDLKLHKDGSVFIDHTCLDLGQKGEKADGVVHKIKNELRTTSDNKETLRISEVKYLDDQSDVAWVRDGDPSTWSSLLKFPVRFILLEMTRSILHQGRAFFDWLKKSDIDLPVILVGRGDLSKEELTIHAGAELGALLLDGYGEGVLLPDRSLGLSLLQACRMRFSKTEFISCPGCGRTLFDLQEVTKRIQSKTAHLPGVKIAIMGCIVNGIGEMVDADFGYVGSRRGKVDLYVGKKRVEKSIDFALADEVLIKLIKERGLWIEPEAVKR